MYLVEDVRGDAAKQEAAEEEAMYNHLDRHCCLGREEEDDVDVDNDADAAADDHEYYDDGNVSVTSDTIWREWINYFGIH